MRTDGKTGSGVRPGRLLSVVVQVLIIAGMVGVVTGYVLVPSWRDTVNSVISSITDTVMPSADPVSTAGAARGPSITGHEAQKAFDGTTGYWAAPFADGAPPRSKPRSGPSPTSRRSSSLPAHRLRNCKSLARPRGITLDLLSAEGVVIVSRDYEMKDEADPQAFDVGAREAATVRVTVRSVYLASTADAPVAITEIQFFGKLSTSSPAATP